MNALVFVNEGTITKASTLTPDVFRYTERHGALLSAPKMVVERIDNLA